MANREDSSAMDKLAAAYKDAAATLLDQTRSPAEAAVEANQIKRRAEAAAAIAIHQAALGNAR